MGESRQKYLRIDGPGRSFEDTANYDHADNAILTHEAVFEKSPLAIPADQARVNLESLDFPQIVTKLDNRVANDGHRLVLPCHPQHTGAHEPMDAANVGKCEIAAVVDMEVQIQVVWPHPKMARVVASRSTLEGPTARAFHGKV